MKKLSLFLSLMFPLVSIANTNDKAQIAYQKAINFGHAVYCLADPLHEKSNVFLMDEDKENGSISYVVSYSGDCEGGTGTHSVNLTPVYFGPSALMNNGYIDIENYDLFSHSRNEINTRFIEKITQSKKGIINVISYEFGENDPNGFPSKKYMYEVQLPEMKVLNKKQIK